MSSNISTNIKYLIESIIDNGIDSTANTIKAHKGKVAIGGGIIAYNTNPNFKHLVKNITNSTKDYLQNTDIGRYAKTVLIPRN